MLAPIVYWFAKTKKAPESFLRDIVPRYGGCADAPAHALLDGVPHCMSGDSEGPEPGRGCLYGFGGDWPVVYKPTLYRFDRIAPGWWVGVNKHAEPHDFQRLAATAGIAVKLGDGNLWEIPVANPLVDTCSLPCSDVLVDQTWQRFPDDAHAPLADAAIELASAYRQAAVDGGDFRFDDDRLRQICGLAISANYNLTLQEMSALRLFNAEVWPRIVEALIDWPTYLRILQLQLLEAGTEATPNPTH